jgi:excisionase family DNA binding protein
MTRLEAAMAELIGALREEMRGEARPSVDAPDRLLSIEAARQVMGGISRSTMYGELTSGRLRSLRVGRRRLIPASAIAERMNGDGMRKAPTSGQKVRAREVRGASTRPPTAAA